MKCVPKSYPQAMGEVKVTADFLNNFSGDNVRRLAKVSKIFSCYLEGPAQMLF